MVPLERVLKERRPGGGQSFHFKAGEPPPPPPPEPRRPFEFKVIDIVSREVLAEAADARTTVKTLEDVRSIVDVMVYVWDPDRGCWRLLTLSETQALWEYRGRIDQADVTAAGAAAADPS